MLYPDPWWKRRHQVKRLFTLPFLDLVHDLLAPGGLLHVRSDVEGYAEYIEQVVAEHGGFTANDPALPRHSTSIRPPGAKRIAGRSTVRFGCWGSASCRCRSRCSVIVERAAEWLSAADFVVTGSSNMRR